MFKKFLKIDKSMGESRAAQIIGAVILFVTLGFLTILTLRF